MVAVLAMAVDVHSDLLPDKLTNPYHGQPCGLPGQAVHITTSGFVRCCTELLCAMGTLKLTIFVYGPFLLKLPVTVKIMYNKKVFQMCNKYCQGCSCEQNSNAYMMLQSMN